MMAFPSMLVSAAQKAGMKTPPDKEVDEKIDKEKYPHFWIYCQLQLGRAIEWGEHWENAKIIAAIPEEELKTMKLEDFLAKGLRWKQ